MVPDTQKRIFRLTSAGKSEASRSTCLKTQDGQSGISKGSFPKAEEAAQLFAAVTPAPSARHATPTAI